MIKTSMLALALVAAVGCGKKKSEEKLEPTPTMAGSAASAGSATAAAGSAAGSADEGPITPYTPAANVPDAIKAAVTAPDRSDADRRIDFGRKPGEVMAFFGIAPGQKVGELVAGGGYTSEVLARIVGDKGHVWAQNPAGDIYEKHMKKPWEARAAKPVMQNVTGVQTPMESPLPADATNLDAVVTIINYHDLFNSGFKTDRAAMNKAVFAALKQGGVYGIVDSSAQPGSGSRDTETLHRIDEDVVKQEVTAAGFKLAGESDVLRSPDDKRDWNTSPRASGARRGTGDKFVLKFVKP